MIGYPTISLLSTVIWPGVVGGGMETGVIPIPDAMLAASPAVGGGEGGSAGGSATGVKKLRSL